MTPDREPIGYFDGMAILIGPGDTTSTQEERETAFTNAVVRFTLDSICLLVSALMSARMADYHAFAARVREVGGDPRINFRPYMLRRLLARAISERQLPDQATKVIGIEELFQADLAVANLVDQSDAERAGERNAGLVVARISQAQMHDLVPPAYFFREAWLAIRTAEEAERRGVKLDAHYQRETGFSFRESLFLSFAFVAANLNAPEAINEGEPDLERSFGFNSEQVEHFKALRGLTYAEFQEQTKHPAVRFEDYALYSLSPTVNWPLLHLDAGGTALPIPSDLLDRPTRSLFFDASSVLTSSDRDRLQSAQGFVFERFVGDCLRTMSSAGDVHDVDDYRAPGDPGCDFICSTPSGPVLVEAKSGRFKLRAELLRSPDALKDELAKDGGLADAVLQLVATLGDIRAGNTPISRGDRAVGFIVVAHDYVSLNERTMREMLDNVVRERLGRPAPILYQIVNGYGFDQLVRAEKAGRLRLAEFLLAKSLSTRRSAMDFHLTPELDSDQLPAHPLDHQFNEAFGALVGGFHLTP